MVQWLKLCAHVQGSGLNPGLGTKIPHAVQCEQEKQKNHRPEKSCERQQYPLPPKRQRLGESRATTHEEFGLGNNLGPEGEPVTRDPIWGQPAEHRHPSGLSASALPVSLGSECSGTSLEGPTREPGTHVGFHQEVVPPLDKGAKRKDL